MSKAKAQYNAPLTFAELVTGGLRTGVEPKVRDFSPVLHSHLRMIYAKKVLKKDAVSVCPGERQCPECQFADEVLSEARHVRAALEHLREGINKADLLEERRQLATRLQAAINKIKKAPRKYQVLGFSDLAGKLRRISPDLDSLLGTAADPRGSAGALEGFATGDVDAKSCAIALRDLLNHISAPEVANAINDAPEKLRDRETFHWAAVDLAARIGNVFENFGITSSAYASAHHDRASDLIAVLDQVGKELKIKIAPVTWQSAVRESRRDAKNGGS